jgi:hypothetical protein
VNESFFWTPRHCRVILDFMKTMVDGNETVKVQVCTMNIETKLFINAAGKYAVRMRDLDAEENITISIFPSRETAEAYFDHLIKAHDSKPVVSL